MYNSIFEEQQGSVVQISLVQVFLIIIIITSTLVIPAQLISQGRNPTPPEAVYTASALRERELGQVAGAETEGAVQAAMTTETNRTLTLPLINTQIDLSTETGVLLLSGTILILLAVLLLTYSVITAPQYKKRKR